MPFSFPKRPLWVWVIAIFYFGFGLSGLMAITMAFLLQLQVTIPAEQTAALNHLMRSSLYGLLPAASIAGAVALFRMRRMAFYIFVSMLAVRLVQPLLFHPLLPVPVKPEDNSDMVIGYAMGYVILIAVCIYTFTLKKAGHLK